MNTNPKRTEKLVERSILIPYILLTTLFFAWAVPNNLTDTMLAAFKRIMILSDAKTAWIQVVCYLLGYIAGRIVHQKVHIQIWCIAGVGPFCFRCHIVLPCYAQFIHQCRI